MDYQHLIDNNWRRSGTYLYRPVLEKSCCPAHTIRLDVTSFVATKQQNQLLRRMSRFLNGEIDLLSEPAGAAVPATKPVSKKLIPPAVAAVAAKLDALLESAIQSAISSGNLPPEASTVLLAGQAGDCSAVATSSLVSLNMAALNRDVASSEASGGRAKRGGNKPLFSTAVALRIAAACPQTEATPEAVAAALVASWVELPDCVSLATAALAAKDKPFVNLSIVDTHALASLAAEAAIVRGGAPACSLAPEAASAAGSAGGAKHVLRVEAVRARFDEDSFELYKRYQRSVHGDEDEKLTREQYEGFLVESPLLQVPLTGPAKPAAQAVPAAVDTAGEEEVAELAGAAAALGVPVELLKAAKRFTGGLEAGAALVQQALPTLGAEALMAALAGAPNGRGGGGGGAADEAARRGAEAQAAAWAEGEGAGRGIPLVAEGTDAALPGFASDAVAAGLGGAEGEGGTDMALGYGSFHHRYFLDDRLVAVGVVDVLPLCLSSVYVFYDPDLPRLQLGRYTALREVQWVQRVSRRCPRLRYYYMGFYIHSCAKMRYKAEYRPSQLLCPVTGAWVDYADAKPLLDTARFARLQRAPEGAEALTAAAGEAAAGPAAAAGTNTAGKRVRGPKKKPKKHGKHAKSAATVAAASDSSSDGLSAEERAKEAATELIPVTAAERTSALELARGCPVLLVNSETVCYSKDLHGNGPQLVDTAITELVLRTSPEFVKRCLVYF